MKPTGRAMAMPWEHEGSGWLDACRPFGSSSLSCVYSFSNILPSILTRWRVYMALDLCYVCSSPFWSTRKKKNLKGCYSLGQLEGGGVCPLPPFQTRM
jgi:hypothetical protein